MKKHSKKLITMLLVIAMLIPTVAMIYSSAATTFTVELAFDNLFVFDHWVTNGNSMIIDNDFGSTNAGSITEIDLNDGSFKFTNNTDHNIYTRAAAGTGEKTQENFDYYRMPVEEGASYIFSCNFTGTSPAFYPHVFFYNESNEFTGAGAIVNGNFNGEGDHSFNFTVPAGAKYIQLRLAIAGNNTKDAYAVIKDIAISKYDAELETTNLFDFDTWAANTKSSVPHGYYCDGTVTNNTTDKSVTFNTNTNGDTGAVYTGFAIDESSATNNEGYYTIDVEPNTTYTFSYHIVSEGCTLGNFVPYIAEFNSSNLYTKNLYGVGATQYGSSSFTFTTGAEASHVQVSFSVWHNNQTWTGTIKDIGLYKTYITDYTVDPVRKTYSYDSSSTATYGELPTPPTETYPENYIFAGWYTEKDGKGTRIAADTEILPQSMTVYPKFEPAVDTLTVKTPPAKTTYTVGEKINTTGLVLTYGIVAQENIYDDNGNVTGTQEVTRTTDISSGFYIDPEYASSTAGTQTITAHYGGKTATFTITVSEGDDKNIVVNGNTHAVTVANNNYTINYQATEPFNRYEMTYFSDSYVKGEIVMDDATEEFFLEPSSNGTFASYIDNFLNNATHNSIVSIKFTCLDKEFGNFELLSLTTIASTVPTNATQYYENAEIGYKVGIDLSFGGVVSEIYDLNNVVESRVYTIDGKNVTKVDYAERLDADYGTGYISRKTENVNLINKFDRGRYLQQSYYGTSQKPYELGNYNGQEWPYNPVQGGNLVVNDENGNPIKGNEASKVIDYRITNEQIYIKTRPLDWGKNSVDYPDSYVTDSYMEAWYVFEDGMIKTYCRFVDYSGYPSHTRSQELPAVYIIEPLNHFVYNNVADGSEWTTTNFVKEEEPEFWGVLPSYNATLTANGLPTVDPTVDCYENWAAFTASDDASSFGVGVYSAGVTDFHYGCFYAKYNEEEAENGNLVATTNRHAVTTDPATENPTSYISPVDDMTFESYSPIEYSYYLTTGTADEIYTDFKNIATKESQAELDKAKIAVPETVYMTPAEGASTVGQYYVNNLLDESDSYNIITEAERDAGMSIGLHIKDAATFSVKITNVTDPSNDIFLCNTSGSEISESERIPFDATDTYTNNTTYGLRFSGAGLQPGEKATAKWEITVYLDDGTVETYTAYTVMYAPGRTVGAVAEARQVEASVNEISSWITGANGVDHSQRAPLGSFKGDMRNSGYFRVDPLVNPDTLPTGGSSDTSYDYILGYGTPNGSDDDYTENAYVMQTATNGHDSSRSQSYLGLLTVDKSRYSNTDQIPNLKIGYDVLRVGTYTNNSLGEYTTYYTLGTESSYTSTDTSAAPSGWTTFSGKYTDFASNHTIPYRESFIPSFDVSTIDGKYIHAVNQGKADQAINSKQWATAGTSVLCSVTDKSTLRDTVTDGYGLKEEDYTEDSYNKFLEELEDAATVLGDPSASQDEIDQANKDLTNAIEEMTEVYYSLKYDNLFSAYEFSQHSNSMTMSQPESSVSYQNGTITIVNETLGFRKDSNGNDVPIGETYTNYASVDGYYLVNLTPNTEYVFEYTSETTSAAQAFMFFYNSSGGAGDVPTNMSVKVNNGSWSSKSESNAWWGNYQYSAGTNHYVIKFTTGANTYKAGFRFGNTSHDPVTSTFSNIRLIDAAHYYEDATYSKTEDVYKKYASYGTLVTPVRPGYTFNGWQDASGNTVTGATIAEQHLSIFSQWTEHSYNIIYNANGGSGTIASENYKYTATVTLASNGFTKSGYNLSGWSTDPNAATAEYALGQKVSGLSTEANGKVTLYAVWASARYNVTFDNMFDFDAFTISTGSLSIDERTDTGFTVTSLSGTDANTGFSYSIPVEPGKTYVLSADIAFTAATSGNTYDMYVQTLNSSNGNDTSSTADKSNGTRVESGCYIVRSGSANADNFSIRFTAGATTTQVKVRFDANKEGNKLTVNNIRLCEDTGITVSPVNKYVSKDSTYGTLPTPTRAGYTFQGWYDGNNLVTESTNFTKTSTVYLTSKWVINDSALVADTVVIDFGTPVKFMPLANDTILTSASGTKTLLGFSKDGGASYAATLAGTYGNFSFSGTEVTYTPAKVVDGTDEVYYYVSDGTTTVKNKITIVPASNVLYEDTMFVAGSGTTGVEWQSAGGTALNLSTSDDGIYGYDTSYISNSQYSNNTALTATIDSSTKRSRIITFTFTGTGFDLYSACGATTGVQIVTVKNNTTGKVVNATVVDTYYNDTSYSTLYQVPIVSITDLDHGSYTVQVAATYISNSGAVKNANNNVSSQSVNGIDVYSATADNAAVREMLANVGMEYVLDAEEVNVVWFDDDSVFNGGKGAETQADGTVSTASTTVTLLNVIDSIRIYNPIVNGDAYYNTNEAGAQYYNVMDNLMNGGSITAESLFAYVSGNANSQITIDNYNSIGPKDEIYLANATTKAITFTVGNVNADTRVMISLRAAYGKPTAKIGNVHDEIPGNTEMYYDITDYIDKATGTVTIQNTSTDASLLAIGYVKVTGATATVLNTFNLETASAMMAAPSEEVAFNAPKAEPDATTPEEDTSTPEEDAGADDSSDAAESWLTRLINYIVELVKKIVSLTKSLFASVTSLLSF